jgi:hypothetical protein
MGENWQNLVTLVSYQHRHSQDLTSTLANTLGVLRESVYVWSMEILTLSLEEEGRKNKNYLHPFACSKEWFCRPLHVLFFL